MIHNSILMCINQTSAKMSAINKVYSTTVYYDKISIQFKTDLGVQFVHEFELFISYPDS